MILLTVDKYLDILSGSGDTATVQTVSYAYNVFVQGLGNIFRYDNQDDYFVSHLGHGDKHHKHSFSYRTGHPTDNVTWVGHKKWPLLSQVITEAKSWYWNNFSDLTRPNQYAEVGRREIFQVLPLLEL